MKVIFRAAHRSSKSSILFIKRLLIVLIVLTTVISLFGHLANKDRPRLNVREYSERQQAKLYEPIQDVELNSTQEGRALLSVYRSASCGLFGETCTDNPDEAQKYKEVSVFGSITNIMAMPFSAPPASAIGWARDGLESSGLIPKTYAAEGIGFSSIKGFMYVWTAFRNIALLLLVILTIVLGFLIMFRANLDGQTAVSIQSILPRIVLTMLYVSFSFAIAGFLVDLMYVLIGISVQIVWGSGLGMPTADVVSVTDKFVTASMGNLFWLDINPFAVGSAFWDMIPAEFKGILDLFILKTVNVWLVGAILKKIELPFIALSGVGVEAGFLGFSAGGNVGNLVQLVFWMVQLAVSGFVAWILPALIIGLIIILTMIFFAFRIFAMLLTSYIKIMIYILFAPFIILFEVIPGNGSFSWWIKNLAAELITFPTVVTIMLTGQMISQINDTAGRPTLGSTLTLYPPNTFQLPFLYGFRPEDFNLIVALGIILITPDFVKMIKGLMGVKESPINLTLGTFFTGASAIMGGGLGLATKAGGLTTTMPGLQKYIAKIPGMSGIANELFTRSEATSKVQDPS
ncbi:hypothetical protein KBD81_05680 [Candidatus Woesebacteria bacterium]|nr:hypothetical protein [Candidatus Woesebacteria bacterium]